MSFEWVRLSDCCLKIGSGATPKGGKDVYLEKGPYALFRSQNVYNDGFSPGGLAYISEEQAKKLDGVAVEDGDVLLNITGDSVARVCMTPADYLPARVNQHVAIIRPRSQIFDSRFLRYFLASPSQQDFMLGIAAAGATRNALTKGMIEDFKVPCPPLHEQKAIAETLTALDDRITLLRETNATLEAIAQALFKSWFVDFDPVRAKASLPSPCGRGAGGEGNHSLHPHPNPLPQGEGAVLPPEIAALFPDSFEESELGWVPKGWLIRGIDEICELGRGSSPRPIQKFMGGDVPWVKIADATASDGMFVFETKEKIIKDGIKNSVQVQPGDLIMSNSASCGITVFVELHGCIHDGWLYFKNYQYISKNFLFFWLRKIANHLVHIADGSVQKNLNIAMVSSQKIICPSPDIIEAYDQLVSPLLSRIRENCIQAQTLAALRDTLLPRLISGQLRLPNDNASHE